MEPLERRELVLLHHLLVSASLTRQESSKKHLTVLSYWIASVRGGRIDTCRVRRTLLIARPPTASARAFAVGSWEDEMRETRERARQKQALSSHASSPKHNQRADEQRFLRSTWQSAYPNIVNNS